MLTLEECKVNGRGGGLWVVRRRESTEVWKPKPWRSRVKRSVLGAVNARSSLSFTVSNVEHRGGAVECRLLLRVIHVVMAGRLSAGDNVISILNSKTATRKTAVMTSSSVGTQEGRLGEAFVPLLEAVVLSTVVVC